jgi:hypothetical protein
MNQMGAWNSVAWEAEGDMMNWLWAYSGGKFCYSPKAAENPVTA